MVIVNKCLYIIFLLTLLTACEEVVQLDLAQAPPRDVIDASIKEGSPCFVLLTQTKGFYDKESYNRLSGAKVELTDDKDNADILIESQQEAGFYVSSIVGRVGRTYKLKVTIGENIYTSEAKIPNIVPIDSVYIYKVTVANEAIYSPCVVFYDPVDVENYYYTTLYVNEKAMKSLYLDSDKYRNGLKVENILLFDKEDNNDEALKVGDKLRIEMQALDKGMYTFYRSLSSVAAGGGTNPLTNIVGGALGCFKAYNSVFVNYTVTEDDMNK